MRGPANRQRPAPGSEDLLAGGGDPCCRPRRGQKDLRRKSGWTDCDPGTGPHQRAQVLTQAARAMTRLSGRAVASAASVRWWCPPSWCAYGSISTSGSGAVFIQ
ncbi:hypothetical protein GCM10023100_00160 [Actinocorallia cavernae]|uniref:Uncharacterized protein n=1 Tax=Actinocorallia cavernae TaxID=328075 RepID=A0ABP8S5F1_9ACTN